MWVNISFPFYFIIWSCLHHFLCSFPYLELMLFCIGFHGLPRGHFKSRCVVSFFEPTFVSLTYVGAFH
jgi:hypothetical protein